MIVKECDADEAVLNELERCLKLTKDPMLKTELQYVRGRLTSFLTAESACEFINEWVAESPDWMVLHDLRLDCGRGHIHTNHLLISPALELYWIDSRYQDFGMEIDGLGGVRIQKGGTLQAVASPISKQYRDLRLLNELLGSHFGKKRWFRSHFEATMRGFVLTSSRERIKKPVRAPSSAECIITENQLFPLIWKDRQQKNEASHWGDNMPASARELAQEIALWHAPVADAAAVLVRINSEEQYADLKPDEEEGQAQSVIARALQTIRDQPTDQLAPAPVKGTLLNQSASQPQTGSLEQSTGRCTHCFKPLKQIDRDYSYRNLGNAEDIELCLACQHHLARHSNQG